MFASDKSRQRVAVPELRVLAAGRITKFAQTWYKHLFNFGSVKIYLLRLDLAQVPKNRHHTHVPPLKKISTAPNVDLILGNS